MLIVICYLSFCTYSSFILFITWKQWKTKFRCSTLYISWRMDWWSYLTGKCITVECLLSFLSCTYFPNLYLHTLIFKFTIIFWKRSLIRPSWSFDLIHEPTIYWWYMVNMHSYFLWKMFVSKLLLIICGSEINQNQKSNLCTTGGNASNRWLRKLSCPPEVVTVCRQTSSYPSNTKS